VVSEFDLLHQVDRRRVLRRLLKNAQTGGARVLNSPLIEETARAPHRVSRMQCSASAEGLNWVRLGQAVEPCEQANALTAETANIQPAFAKIR
jgi:hypothetical protein